MTRDELLAALAALNPADPRDADLEGVHVAPDALLLDYIGDAEIRRAFLLIPKWYS